MVQLVKYLNQEHAEPDFSTHVSKLGAVTFVAPVLGKGSQLNPWALLAIQPSTHTVCVCTYMHTYIHTHIYTYTHTYALLE